MVGRKKTYLTFRKVALLIHHAGSAERSSSLPLLLPCPSALVASLWARTHLPIQVSSGAMRSGKVGTEEWLDLGLGLHGCPVSNPFCAVMPEVLTCWLKTVVSAAAL